jgi:non-ribosomal peptide synthetase component F
MDLSAGILKVGAAYIPLDPIYPPERIASVLDDVGVGILLTQQSLLKALGSVIPRLCIDQDWHERA